ncbi:MAG: glycosyltransferase family 39 protein [Holosporaceae bacterium]|jgi:hypothetical protein|nr:glycosyltransferase family 39 protein [Holosporaceae bacterium]
MAVNVLFYLQLHGFSLTFVDTDDYMRLVRIREFFNHHDWGNTIISRSNVPFGCDLHWTRFYDFFIIIPVYLLNFFVNSLDKSIEWCCFVISPIVKSITVVIFFRFAQQLMYKRDAFLLAVLFAVHPLIMVFGNFGRPDHHAFIMLFIIIHLYSVINIMKLGFQWKTCLWAAITTTLCIWISPETLIPILLANGILFIYAFPDIERLRLLHTKFLLISCFTGLIVFFNSGYGSSQALAGCILLLITPYTVFHKEYAKDAIFRYWHVAVILLMLGIFPLISPVEYDKISVVHLALFTCGALYVGINMMYHDLSMKSRGAVALAWLLIIGSVFLLIYPGFLSGMSANIDDYVKEIWLYKVREMKSPIAEGDLVFFITYGAVTLILAVNKALKLIHKRNNITDFIWWIIVANAVCYTIFAGMAYRMLPYSMLFALPLIVDFGMTNAFLKSFHWGFRVFLIAFFSLFLVFCTSYLDHSEESGEPSKAASYTPQELSAVIDGLSKDPVVIMAHTNDGPMLLYYTKHSVVGAPYHRQQQGIIASYKVMEDEYDEKVAKDTLKATNSSYIFIRNGQYKKAKARSLSKMIINNAAPEWIKIIPLPSKFNDVTLAKVVI